MSAEWFSLTGRTALVAGASRDIGGVIAVPLGRWGGPRDVAAAALWLAGDAARYTIGATVPADGGLSTCHSRAWLDAMATAVAATRTGELPS